MIEGIGILAKRLTSTPNVREHHNLTVEPYGRGVAVKWVGGFQVPLYFTMAVDAAGVVVGRIAKPADPNNSAHDKLTLATLKQRYLEPLVQEIATTLEAAEAYGHVVWEMLVCRPPGIQWFGVTRQPNWWLHASADGVMPAEGGELAELVDFWTRHVAREAGEPLWEGSPIRPAAAPATPYTLYTSTPRRSRPGSDPPRHRSRPQAPSSPDSVSRSLRAAAIPASLRPPSSWR